MVEKYEYTVPPLERVDLDYVLNLIRDQEYFFLNAPRQTGKTTVLLALQKLLNSGTVGDFRCVYVNLEGAQTAREDVERAMRSILGEFALRAQDALEDDFVNDTWLDTLEKSGPYGALAGVLAEWSMDSPQPLVLLVDEIDALVGDTLISVLRQLRSGYDMRPDAYPQSVVLCGVRQVRDYRIRSGSSDEPVTGGGVFNVSAASLRLGDFGRAEVEALLGQHTAETGQEFEPAALERLWTQTQGQPWLVNALCSEACFETPQGLDRSRAITEDDILAAQEVLIRERVVHLDQLAAKLQEDGVQRVVEPMLSGASPGSYTADDLEYVRDLGLVSLDRPPRIANPIYAEVVPRELTCDTEAGMLVEPARYIDDDGSLHAAKLLEGFQEYCRKNAEHELQLFQYRQAGPQLLLQAFLQRVSKGRGRIEREYGSGFQRVDLLLLWPRLQGMQRIAIECKVLKGELEETLEKGLPQTADYMGRCGADAGHLVIFDRGAKPWKEKIFHRSEEYDGTPVEVWGV